MKPFLLAANQHVLNGTENTDRQMCFNMSETEKYKSTLHKLKRYHVNKNIVFPSVCNYFLPSVGPCLPNVLMTLAIVTTVELHFSFSPS